MNEPLCQCPSCHSRGVASIGTIPTAHYFAGKLMSAGSPNSELIRCRECELCFRFPFIPKDELDRLYSESVGSAWNYSIDQRMDWQKTIAFLEKSQITNGKVLDVGCYDGQFAAYLPAGYERFGVEFNSDAASQAKQKGVNVLGQSIEAIPAGFSAQVTTAFDIIEHLHDPRRFLHQLRDAPSAGGSIVIASGNTDAPTFRFMRSQYWYCALYEHITFISESWCRKAAAEAGLEIQCIERFSHRGHSWARPIVSACQAVANIPFKIAPVLSAKAKKALLCSFKGRHHITGNYVSWNAAKDHLWAVFRKP